MTNLYKTIKRGLRNCIKQKILINIYKKIILNKDKYHQIMDDYKSYYKKNSKILNTIIDLYKLYYKITKDYFIIKEQVNEKVEDFLNL